MSPSMMSTGRGRGMPELRSISRSSAGGIPRFKSSMNCLCSSYLRKEGIAGIACARLRESPRVAMPVRLGAEGPGAAAASSSVVSSTVNPSAQKITRTFFGLCRSGNAPPACGGGGALSSVGVAAEPRGRPVPPHLAGGGGVSFRAFSRIGPTRSTGSVGNCAAAASGGASAGVEESSPESPSESSACWSKKSATAAATSLSHVASNCSAIERSAPVTTTNSSMESMPACPPRGNAAT
mmetsp:Transcript_39435/g.97777  ORF Transcript_39435/g.97777 Transcript_39435/m.97777 type:complete len:238 (+) Transcript_39435:689-1402(+)